MVANRVCKIQNPALTLSLMRSNDAVMMLRGHCRHIWVLMWGQCDHPHYCSLLDAISPVWFETERDRERQWQQHGLRMFLFACVDRSHQFPSTSQEQCWIEDCLMSSGIAATDLRTVINPLRPSSCCELIWSINSVILIKTSGFRRFLKMWSRSSARNSSSFSPYGSRGIWSPLPAAGSTFESLRRASSCQKIKSSVNAFLWWRDKQKESLESNVTTSLLLCAVAANKGPFSVEQDLCEPK